MALKTTLETLDGVDDAIKSLYTQVDDTFVLQLEGINSHPEVANLKTAYDAVKAKREALKLDVEALNGKLADFPDDFDIKVWNAKKEGKTDEADQIAMRSQYEADVSEWKGKFEALQSTTTKLQTENTLSDALAANGVTEPSYVKASKAMLSDKVKLSDDGRSIVETDMGPMAVPDYVKRWVGDEGKAFVSPPTGGGARGGDKGGSDKSGGLVGAVPALADLPEK